jgi:hypothetical protein
MVCVSRRVAPPASPRAKRRSARAGDLSESESIGSDTSERMSDRLTPLPSPRQVRKHFFIYYIYILLWLVNVLHWKDTVPKIRNKYFQKWNCAASFQIPTSMYLWTIYIFPQSVHLHCCSKIGGQIVNYSQIHEYGNWERGGGSFK